MNHAALLLETLPPRKIPKQKPPQDKSWQPRYEQAYKNNFKEKYPAGFAAGGFIKLKFPDTTKANGLTNAIINFILWNGYRATRISASGRMVDGKFIPGTTRKGSADVSSTIRGKSVMWEVKVGNDMPSENQLKEQALERKAGGEYFFIHDFKTFLIYYDTIITT